MPVKDPARKKVADRLWKQNHPEATAAHLRKYRYGISDVDFNRLSDQQGFLCAICCEAHEDDANKKNKTLHVDHCQTDGHVRGLLCAECNLGLGKFMHSISRFQSAIQYLLDTQ